MSVSEKVKDKFDKMMFAISEYVDAEKEATKSYYTTPPTDYATMRDEHESIDDVGMV